MADYICNRMDEWRRKNRGSGRMRVNSSRPSFKDNPRQFIDDYIAERLEPVMANLDEMVADAFNAPEVVNALKAIAVANRNDPAVKAMSAHGIAGADFHARANERKRMSDAYIALNPRAVTNSNDPAVQGMSANVGVAEHLRRKREGE